MTIRSKIIAAIVIIAVVAGGLAFTNVGHRVLYTLGIATACGDGPLAVDC